jgi:hypothetical protein
MAESELPLLSHDWALMRSAGMSTVSLWAVLSLSAMAESAYRIALSGSVDCI